MTVAFDELVNSASIRDDYVPKADYLSREFAELEARYVWPKVWQIACREEEIPHPGDFITFDILNDSVIVLRNTSGEIKAFFNACPHRGRRLLDKQGHITGIQCRFHGWKFDLNGTNKLVLDEGDWGGCLKPDDIKLESVRAERWGGFVFVNFDDNAPPLSEYLKPVSELCRNFEFEKMRYRWYKSVRLKCNWKTVLEGFNEAYHVAQTHPQLLNYFEDYTNSRAYGIHGAFWYPTYPPMARSKRLTKAPPKDNREYVLDYVEEFDKELVAMVTPRAYQAAQRLRTDLSPDTPVGEILMKWSQWTREIAEAEGAGWPPVTADDLMNSHADWHVFPNFIFLHGNVDGLLAYRARPDGNDPDSCIFDAWSLVRYAPGGEPPLQKEFYNDWRDHDGWGRILTQDFNNFEDIQRGMKTRSFRGSRTNPVQERVVVNFHRTIHQYIEKGRAQES